MQSVVCAAAATPPPPPLAYTQNDTELEHSREHFQCSYSELGQMQFEYDECRAHKMLQHCIRSPLIFELRFSVGFIVLPTIFVHIELSLVGQPI